MQNNIMESQNVEYKQSWRDEYLKWICGFANAQGGTLYIGVDDNGEVCGVENAKRINISIGQFLMKELTVAKNCFIRKGLYVRVC